MIIYLSFIIYGVSCVVKRGIPLFILLMFFNTLFLADWLF